MNKENILEKAIALFTTMSDADEITAESELMEDLDLASMDVLFVISSLEEEFGVKVDETMIQNMYTVGDVADIVAGLMK